MIEISELWSIQDAQDLYKHKNNQSNITLKQRNRKQILYVTLLPDQIHTSIKLHEDIPIGYRVMACTTIFEKKRNLKGIAWKLRKREQSFL